MNVQRQDESPDHDDVADRGDAGAGPADGTGAAGSQARTSPSPPGQVLQQSEVDSIIRKKRKQREYKACYPCRYVTVVPMGTLTSHVHLLIAPSDHGKSSVTSRSLAKAV